MGIDRYYTPAEACGFVYSAWTASSNRLLVGDFCCGEGALLSMAPFSNKVVYAMDVDEDVVRRVKKEHPAWHVKVDDFLRPGPSGKRFLRSLLGKLDVVVLNPPFSCRGGKCEQVLYSNSVISCSMAMAFFVKCLDYLNDSGSMMAILPRSVLRSDKDKDLLDKVRQHWDLTVNYELSRSTFEGCFPHSVCVTVSRRARPDGDRERSSGSVDQSAPNLETVNLVRGVIPMHETSSNEIFPVLHTRDLRNPEPIGVIARYSKRPGRQVKGCFLALPRVGAPDIKKVRILDAPYPVTLSDCVFAMSGDTQASLQELHALLTQNWERLEQLYASTCAPYLTIGQLSSFLLNLGWKVVVVNGLDSSVHTLANSPGQRLASPTEASGRPAD